uniref:Exonuclease 1 n=1 Tax=Loa loa TaxID=7209 RepID=A0A1I7VKD7_LOALO
MQTTTVLRRGRGHSKQGSGRLVSLTLFISHNRNRKLRIGHLAMGIHNLLPFVKNACRQGNINEFAHQSVAVDVSCLLHRGLIGCADKVAQGCETDFYIRYVLKYVRALLAIGCHIILVFDGQMLPAKKETNSSRREKRDFHKQRGDLLLSEGRASEAYDCFKRSTSLTPRVIETAIQAFRRLNMVDVIVAPYESDAQLTFLTKTKMVQAVVTEDSDLIAFGCEKAGLPGVGLNKAAAFFAKTDGRNLYQILPRLPRYLNKNSLKVTKQFIDDFIRAENTFLYQIVFDPVEKRQRPLNDYPLNPQSNEDDDEFESSRPPPLRISDSLSTMDSKILANSLTDDNDDFVLCKKTKDLHKKVVETSKTKQISTKIDRKLTHIHSIGVARNGNGARKNWNCDRLLKEFATTTNMSQKNATNSHRGENLNLSSSMKFMRIVYLQDYIYI